MKRVLLTVLLVVSVLYVFPRHVVGGNDGWGMGKSVGEWQEPSTQSAVVSRSRVMGRRDLTEAGKMNDNIRRGESLYAVCKRWAGQSAVVNGTLYYFGGRATSSSDQTSNTWSRPIIPSSHRRVALLTTRNHLSLC